MEQQVQSSGSDAVAYEGATVLEAKVSCRHNSHAVATRVPSHLESECLRIVMPTCHLQMKLPSVGPLVRSLQSLAFSVKAGADLSTQHAHCLSHTPRLATTATRWRRWISRRCTPAS